MGARVESTMKNHLWLVPALTGAFVIAAPASRAADNPAPAAEVAQADTMKLTIVTAKGGG
jgi:hypothetical protein